MSDLQRVEQAAAMQGHQGASGELQRARSAGRAKETGVQQSPKDGPRDLKYARRSVHLDGAP